MLYFVATPIGNLKDISFRAIEILKEVDLILCEDTRHSKRLLDHYNISKPLSSFHAHSLEKKEFEILEKLQSGKKIAYISDAGSPGISDPGYRLAKMCRLNKIDLQVIPGASAVISSVTGSGLPCDKFLFFGFLPKKKGRQTLIKSFENLPYSIVFYESPFRILKTLNQLLDLLSDRYISVQRELTKLHEEVFTGKISEAIEKFEKQKPKGEFSIVLAPKDFIYESIHTS